MPEREESPPLVCDAPTTEPIDGPGSTSYVRAIQTSKQHLGVCLKLLGIMCRNDDDSSSQDRPGEGKLEEQNSVWPSESRGDQLYLSMVMLNSALLKALHVADSFQLHCHREFTKIAPPPPDSPTPGDGESWRHIQEDSKTSCEEYRRRQAECFVAHETARSLEQQRESDKARIRQLDDECRQIRAAISKPAEEPVQKKSARPEPREVGVLQDFGVRADWQPEGNAVISETELQRLLLVYQGLSRSVQEGRRDLLEARKTTEEELKGLEKAELQREDTRKTLLGAAGPPQGSLQTSVRHLLSDLSRAEALKKRQDHEREVWAQLQDLHAQGMEVERQCQDLSAENSKLQRAMGDDGNGGSGASSGFNERASSMRDLLKDYDDNGCARSEVTPQSSSRRGGTGSGHRGGGGQHSKHRAVAAAAENGCGDGEHDSVHTVASDGTRLTGRGPRTGSSSGTHRSQNAKPFVVCSSSRSHHSSASHNRNRRPQALPEERQFAKAALRYAKNPADAQALDKLASLLKQGKQSGSARLPEAAASADASPEWSQRRSDPDAGGRIPVSWPPSSASAGNAPAADESPPAPARRSEASRQVGRSASPHNSRAADLPGSARMSPMRVNSDLTTQRLLMQLGKVRGVQTTAWPHGSAPNGLNGRR